MGWTPAFDVSVVSPLQSGLIKKASEEKGSAAVKRYKEKNSKYHSDCEKEGIRFFPLIVETFGGWHPESETTIRKIGMQLASHTEGDLEETCHQRLSILLSRANSYLLLSRSPDYADARIDGDLDVDI